MQTQIATLKKWYDEKPITALLLIGLLLRLVAAVFSKGYGMFDDHFLVIQNPWDFVHENRDWFGKGDGSTRLYIVIHYLFHRLAADMSILDDVQNRMFVIRLVHAFYSLLPIYLAYRITETISTTENAKRVGLFVALFWLMPFMSVRNLVEMTCIPPMLAGILYAIKPEKHDRYFIYAGLWFALAWAIRFQAAIIGGGVGIVLLMERQWRAGLLLAASFAIGTFLTQGLWDWVLYHKPYDAFIGYITHNAEHSRDYTTGAWYVYLALFIGLFIPPMSLLLLYHAVAKTWRRYLVLLLPALLFIAFHSYFPNKQERFVLSVVPLLIMLIVIGYDEWQQGRLRTKPLAAWQVKTVRGLWVWFWMINTALLLLFTFTYSKKTRVETLYHVSKQPDLNALVINGGKLGVPDMPEYYLGSKKGIPVYKYDSKDKDEETRVTAELAGLGERFPAYAIFFGNENMPERVQEFETRFSKRLTLLEEVSPSLLDDAVYYMNPRFNLNQTGYIYRVK
jgi:hypothetical protein